MPVKWDPAMDQLLLLKILETHDLKVDTKKISGSWPDDRGEKPTPRAIQERLVKIRSNSKTAGAGHFGISSTQTKGTSPAKARTAPNTPSKSATSKAASSNSISPTKRKKPDDAIKVEDDEAPVTPSKSKSFVRRTSSGLDIAQLANGPDVFHTPTSGMRQLSVGAQQTNRGAAEDHPSPSKRPRRASANRMTYDSDGDAGGDSEVSEFRFGFDGAADEEGAV